MADLSGGIAFSDSKRNSIYIGLFLSFLHDVDINFEPTIMTSIRLKWYRSRLKWYRSYVSRLKWYRCDMSYISGGNIFSYWKCNSMVIGLIMSFYIMFILWRYRYWTNDYDGVSISDLCESVEMISIRYRCHIYQAETHLTYHTEFDWYRIESVCFTWCFDTDIEPTIMTSVRYRIYVSPFISA